MMNQAALAVDKSALRSLTEVGKGGQGRVWATDSIRINHIWSAVYKEYEPAALAALNVDLLGRMVAFVPELDPGSGRWLCDQAAWPAALVREGGVVRGFLMRRIPADFEMQLPQRDGSHHRKPAGLQFLLNPDDYLAKMAIPIDDRKRLLLLRNLAETLERFHSMGVVVGDLSPNNLMFQLSANPRCFFIDCDAMRLRGASVLQQADTPDWEVPAGEELATPASDAYKLGLLAIRLFARDQSSRDMSALAAVSPELAALARRSQAKNPANRPRPGEWGTVLQAATARLGSPQIPAPPPIPIPPPVPVAVATSSVSAGPAPAPAVPRSGGGLWGRQVIVAITVCAVLLCLLGLITTIASAAEEEPPVAPPPTTTGIVSAEPVAAQPEAVQITAMFEDYFAAINAADWDAALRFYDPAGVVDAGEPAQRRAFARAMSTTTDSDAVLLSVSRAADGTLAQLSFVSSQDAGFGPPRDRDETCTRWTVTYLLTYADGTGYRILRAKNAEDEPC